MKKWGKNVGGRGAREGSRERLIDRDTEYFPHGIYTSTCKEKQLGPEAFYFSDTNKWLQQKEVRTSFPWHSTHKKHYQLIHFSLFSFPRAVLIHLFLHLCFSLLNLSCLFLIDRNCFSRINEFCFYKFAEVYSLWYPSHFHQSWFFHLPYWASIKQGLFNLCFG